MENLETRRWKLRFPTEGYATFILSLYNTEGFIRFVGDKYGDAVDYIRNTMLAIRRVQGIARKAD